MIGVLNVYIEVKLVKNIQNIRQSVISNQIEFCLSLFLVGCEGNFRSTIGGCEKGSLLHTQVESEDRGTHKNERFSSVRVE